MDLIFGLELHLVPGDIMHPFIGNLSDKSLEELQTTISTLTTKLTFAGRTGNRALVNQLMMAIDSYKDAYSQKMDDMIKKQDIQSLINIQQKDSK
jgi:hypothetical protein